MHVDVELYMKSGLRCRVIREAEAAVPVRSKRARLPAPGSVRVSQPSQQGCQLGVQ